MNPKTVAEADAYRESRARAWSRTGLLIATVGFLFLLLVGVFLVSAGGIK